MKGWLMQTIRLRLSKRKTPKSTNKLYNEGTIAAFGTSQLMWADNDTH